jgi:glycosyltransferase involved in cell wall biosynthesis
VKLLIAIPALDEEESIASVIERTLQARAVIVQRTAVTDVEVTVVSDGSTDRTVERARQFGAAITLIVLDQNRGYGAAIMEAWRHSDAELVGFLDADGTCDPLCFVELCSAIFIAARIWRSALESTLPAGCRSSGASAMPSSRRC